MVGYYRDDKRKQKLQNNEYTHNNLETVKDILQYPFADVPERGLSKETLEYFGCRVKFTETAPQEIAALYFPAYSKDGKKITGYQKKDLTISKEDPGHFTAIGSVRNTCMLYGQKQCQHGGKKLFITEGWVDCMSAFQALKEISRKNGYGHVNPNVCSIVNGTSNSDKSVAHNEEFVKSFDQIIIAMDNDSRRSIEAENIIRGKEATDLIGSYLSSNNLLVPNYPDNRNDLNEILLEDGPKALNDLLLWNVKPFQAEKIVTFDEVMTFEEAIKPIEQGFMFDEFPLLNEKLGGERLYELTTYTGLPGSGKSSIAFEHIFQEALSGEKVGLLMLEDPVIKTQRRVAARFLKIHPRPYFLNPVECASQEQLREAWEFSINPDRFMILAHFGSIAHKPLMSKIKSLFAAGCTRILFDHASMAVSGLATNDERKELDVLYTELAAFRAAHPVHLKVVAHVDKKAGTQDTTRPTEPKWNYIHPSNLRGSAGLFQLSCNVILIHNEITPDGSRGRVKIGLGKNRLGARLGDCDIVKMGKNGLFYDATEEIWTPQTQPTGY